MQRRGPRDNHPVRVALHDPRTHVDKPVHEVHAAFKQLLKKEHPKSTTALQHKSALELLVATILSAQCTDVRVNIVTKDLFKKYKTAKDYSAAPIDELEQAVKSTGFYRNKAKSIKGTCTLLVNEFEGEVPDNMDDLVKLPGVARKTANVVLGSWYKKNVGVVVDTHVKRLSNRLSLADSEDPSQIENELMKKIPQEAWIDFSHRLIHHGRQTCKARKPLCRECCLLDICPTGAERLLDLN